MKENVISKFNNFQVIKIFSLKKKKVEWNKEECCHIKKLFSITKKRVGNYRCSCCNWMAQHQTIHNNKNRKIVEKKERKYDKWLKKKRCCFTDVQEKKNEWRCVWRLLLPREWRQWHSNRPSVISTIFPRSFSLELWMEV